MNRTATRRLVLVALLAVLVGCSSSPTAANKQQAYLSILHGIPAYAGDSDATLVANGKDVCYKLDHGQTVPQLVSDPGVAASDYPTLVGAAVGAFCPQYANQVNQP